MGTEAPSQRRLGLGVFVILSSISPIFLAITNTPCHNGGCVQAMLGKDVDLKNLMTSLTSCVLSDAVLFASVFRENDTWVANVGGDEGSSHPSLSAMAREFDYGDVRRCY